MTTAEANSGRRITTHEATVKTVQIAVKTMTISDKQVTLSVFRQLLCRDLIDNDTGTLLGLPWGTVNYFWNDCNNSGRSRLCGGSHLHVVWQDGIELRRACVYPMRLTKQEVDACLRFWNPSQERVDEIVDELRSDDDAAWAADQKYKASYESILQLDQLFIAV